MHIELILWPLLVTGPAAADARVQARAALALAAARREDPYAAARRRAVAEGRPLVVWVGCHDARTEAATPGLLHVRVSRFPGVASTCVIFAYPSNGELWRAGDLPPAEATPLRLQNLALSRVKPRAGDCGH
jgi:hypothetical protein